MPVYTVHAPAVADMHAGDPDRFAFVRDGFHFWAAVTGGLWLVWHRLWLALIGWIVLVIGVDIALRVVGAGSAVLPANLLLALLMGFEAASVRRWTLSRRRWRQLDVVVADNREAAERRFFDRWMGRKAQDDLRQPAVDRGAPPPTRNVPGQAFSRPPQDDIIGLFPQPGAPH